MSKHRPENVHKNGVPSPGNGRTTDEDRKPGFITFEKPKKKR